MFFFFKYKFNISLNSIRFPFTTRGCPSGKKKVYPKLWLCFWVVSESLKGKSEETVLNPLSKFSRVRILWNKTIMIEGGMRLSQGARDGWRGGGMKGRKGEGEEKEKRKTSIYFPNILIRSSSNSKLVDLPLIWLKRNQLKEYALHLKKKKKVSNFKVTAFTLSHWLNPFWKSITTLFSYFVKGAQL